MGMGGAKVGNKRGVPQKSIVKVCVFGCWRRDRESAVFKNSRVFHIVVTTLVTTVVGCCWPPRRPLPLAAEEEECPSLEQPSSLREERAVLHPSPSQLSSPEHTGQLCQDAVIESMGNGLEESKGS